MARKQATRSRPRQAPRRGAARPAARALPPVRRRSSGWGLWIAGGAAAIIVLVVAVAIGTRSPSASSFALTGLQTFAETSRNHVTHSVRYDRSPPAGGDHNPVWLNCGVYNHPVVNEAAVHSLEHGAVWITYTPSLSAADVQKLRQIAVGHDGTTRYVILSPYAAQATPIAVTAWGNQLFLTSPDDSRLTQFIDHFRQGPQTLEPGAACSGGSDQPIG